MGPATCQRGLRGVGLTVEGEGPHAGALGGAAYEDDAFGAGHGGVESESASASASASESDGET